MYLSSSMKTITRRLVLGRPQRATYVSLRQRIEQRRDHLAKLETRKQEEKPVEPIPKLSTEATLIDLTTGTPTAAPDMDTATVVAETEAAIESMESSPSSSSSSETSDSSSNLLKSVERIVASLEAQAKSREATKKEKKNEPKKKKVSVKVVDGPWKGDAATRYIVLHGDEFHYKRKLKGIDIRVYTYNSSI
jgi:hypothetical protein